MEHRNGEPDESNAIRALLLFGFLPFWFAPGLLDYAFHRQTHIESTSGTRESALHLAMFSVVGIPVVLSLLYEVDEAIVGSAMLAAAAHEGLTLYDVAYAYERRETGPAEQHVHSFLEVMPIVGAILLACAYPRVSKRLLRRPMSALRPRFARKRTPIPRERLATFFGAVVAFIIAPYGEELVRCMRVHPTLQELPKFDGSGA